MFFFYILESRKLSPQGGQKGAGGAGKTAPEQQQQEQGERCVEEENVDHGRRTQGERHPRTARSSTKTKLCCENQNETEVNQLQVSRFHESQTKQNPEVGEEGCVGYIEYSCYCLVGLEFPNCDLQSKSPLMR